MLVPQGQYNKPNQIVMHGLHGTSNNNSPEPTNAKLSVAALLLGIGLSAALVIWLAHKGEESGVNKKIRAKYKEAKQFGNKLREGRLGG